MHIAGAIMRRSVAQEPFGEFEPFVTGNDKEVTAFYSRVLASLERVRGITVFREADHHGSGYASYVSAFLYPSDSSSRRDFPEYIETTGILLYLSHLAPIAVYGASTRHDYKHNKGSGSGFINWENVGILPEGNWTEFLYLVAGCLRKFQIEILPREPLLQPAPNDISIPTLFDGPYHVLDTLFYWSD